MDRSTSAITAAACQGVESYGNSYLEKMVQLPIELPMPDRIAIGEMFGKRLLALIPEKSKKLFEKDYWREIYLEGIESFLRTPRDVVRLNNALKLTLPMVDGEVNPVDFIAMETLRIFCPLVYDEIRFHPEQFAGRMPKQDEKLTRFHQTWMGHLQEEPGGTVAQMLMKIFPKFESAFKNVLYPDESDWRERLRACSPDKLPVYFRFALPTGDISKAELDDLAALSVNAELFGEALLDLVGQKRPDGRTRVCQALEQLSDSRAAIIPQHGVAGAIRALLEVGDQLIEAKDSAELFGIITNNRRVVRFALLLLGRLDVEQRLDVLRVSVEKGKALSAIVETVFALGSQHGKYSAQALAAEDRLFDASALSVLERVACERICEAAETGSMISTPKFVRVLYGWKDWKGEQSLAEWAQNFLVSDSNLLLFLRKLIPDDTIDSEGDRVADLRERRYLQRVREFVKIEDYTDRLELLNQRHDLTEEDRIRLELLLSDKDQRNKG